MNPTEVIAYRYIEGLKATGQFRKSYWYVVCVNGGGVGRVIGHISCRNRKEATEVRDQHEGPGITPVIVAGNAVI
jgi:hypothetical protein